MLTKLSIGNFKAFGKQQTIPIKPITLFFGANSAGKSSIIQSLLLTHEVERNSSFRLHSSSMLGESWTLSRGNFDIQRPKLAGNLMDLGGFNSFVHRARTGTNVSLSIELELGDPTIRKGLEVLEVGQFVNALPGQFEQGELAKFLEGHRTIGVELEVGRKVPKPGYLRPEYNKQKKDVELVKRWVRDAMDCDSVTVQKCLVFLDDEWIARFERITEFTMELAEVNPESKWVCENLVNENLDLRKPEDAAWFEALATLLPEHLRGKHLGWSHHLQDKAAPLARLCSVLRKVVSIACENFEYLGGMRAVPPRYFGIADETDPNWSSGGTDAWQWLIRSPEIMRKVNRWLVNAPRLRVPFRLEIHRLIDAEVAKRAVQSSIKKSAPSKGDQIKAVAQAFKSSEKSAAPILRLRDASTGTLVSHRDMGLGVSQVLPILINAIGSENRTFCIEQPELHLHPALQAELGDVFIESALGERKNRFLLETHSEHIVLRLLRRVRETTQATLPKGLVGVRPEDLSVVFVEPGREGAQARHLPVTPDGDFAVPWPGGFFAERLEELP